MRPARWPRADVASARLLVVDPRRGTLVAGQVGELAAHLRPGDLLVFNDAATLPASLPVTAPAGVAEVRLAGAVGPSRYDAVLFGAGSWRQRTEDRPPPPVLAVGDRLRVAAIDVEVVAVSDHSPRLVTLRFPLADGALTAWLHRVGRPIQYSYLADDLPIDAFQTAYAGRPWAAEMPSAGRAFTWSVLLGLEARGVRFARLTHATGISATGDAALDALLPLPERSWLPPATVAAIQATRRDGGRVVAVGTSVVRALEGRARDAGGLVAGEGVTDLVIGPDHRLRVVDGVLTGVHEPGESHHRLLLAFASPELLAQASAYALSNGWLGHEFGDSCLLLPG